MEINKIGFIYMITSPTGRLYIGSTINIQNRWKQYYLLKCRSQPKLYNSLIKHTPEKHKFEIIWEGLVDDMYKYETLIGWGFDVLEKEHLNCRLPKLGDTYSVMNYNTKLKIGLKNKNAIRTQAQKDNLKFINLGKKLPIETCIKMGKSRLGNKHALGKTRSKEFKLTMNSHNFKPILQYDLNMNFIKEWNSIKSASEELKINSGHIGQVCMSKRNSIGGFKWKYK
jgi:group I intron endonuclease